MWGCATSVSSISQNSNLLTLRDLGSWNYACGNTIRLQMNVTSLYTVWVIDFNDPASVSAGWSRGSYSAGTVGQYLRFV